MDTTGIEIEAWATRFPVPQPAPEGEPWECHPLAHWPVYEMRVRIGDRAYFVRGLKYCGWCSAREAEYWGLWEYWSAGWLDAPYDQDYSNLMPRAEVRGNRLFLRSGRELDPQAVETWVTGDSGALAALARRINRVIEEAVPAARRPARPRRRRSAA